MLLSKEIIRVPRQSIIAYSKQHWKKKKKVLYCIFHVSTELLLHGQHFLISAWTKQRFIFIFKKYIWVRNFISPEHKYVLSVLLERKSWQVLKMLTWDHTFHLVKCLVFSPGPIISDVDELCWRSATWRNIIFQSPACMKFRSLDGHVFISVYAGNQPFD